MPLAEGAPGSAFDVIVLGGGCAGLASALFAAIAGHQVLLLEKTAWVGGTSAWSAGAVWIPNSHLAPAGDSAEAAARYLSTAIGSAAVPALVEAFLRAGPQALKALHEHSPVQMRAFAYHPDYLSELPGATTAGRVLEALPFDGRLLGDAFDLVRPPIPEFTVLGGMMVDRVDIGHLLHPLASGASLKHTARLLARHAADRLQHRRGTRLVMGNALVGRLLHGLMQRRVPVWTDAHVTGLDYHAGRVRGVSVVRHGLAQHLSARRAVVLASGGFNGNPGLRERLLPRAAAPSARAPGCSGELQQMALQIGARLGSLEPARSEHAFWAPVSMRQRGDGSLAVFPHFVLDRAKPGTLVVDRSGRRFVNESASYHAFASRMLEPQLGAPRVPAFLIADHDAFVKYGLGLVRPGGGRRRRFAREGYLVQAATLPALAAALDLAPEVLVRSVALMNTFAQSGVDTEFGRGSTAYQRNLGDPAVGPNPTLGPIVRPPFCAVRLYPGDIGASTGLVTDDCARVLAGSEPIAGLFAVGNDMHSVMAGSYPGPGINLGPAIAFAYAAVQAIAADPAAVA